MRPLGGPPGGCALAGPDAELMPGLSEVRRRPPEGARRALLVKGNPPASAPNRERGPLDAFSLVTGRFRDARRRWAGQGLHGGGRPTAVPGTRLQWCRARRLPSLPRGVAPTS
jgi:hypothetical protein